jgi:hypothetical protein
MGCKSVGTVVLKLTPPIGPLPIQGVPRSYTAHSNVGLAGIDKTPRRDHDISLTCCRFNKGRAQNQDCVKRPVLARMPSDWSNAPMATS